MNSAAPSFWATLSTRKAFAIHLTLSLLVFSSLIFVMLMWWFPGELFILDGGWQGLKIVALIDLVLGPMLTLVLYKPGKKGLVLDMSLIAGFQLAALAYGFYATHAQRTVAVVYADRNFTTLSADSAETAAAELVALERTPKSIKALHDEYPALLLTPEPPPGQFGKYVSQLLSDYPESHERLDLFEKLGAESHREILEKRAKTQESLETTGADVIVAKAIEKGNFDPNDIEIHHFKARYAKGLVLFSISEQRILDYVPIKWHELIAKKEAEMAANGTEPAEGEQADVNDVETTDELANETLDATPLETPDNDQQELAESVEE